MGVDEEIRQVMKGLRNYIDSMAHFEIIISEHRGILILRWDTVSRNYYAVDQIRDAEELAKYIYGELLEQVTYGTDHTLKNNDLTEEEMREARTVLKQFTALLPQKTRNILLSQVDITTGLLPDPRPVGSSLLL